MVAAVGLANTWRDFGPGEPFLATVYRGWARLRGTLSDLARRILRRHDRVVASLESAVAIASASRARVRVQYGNLAKGDVVAAIGVLERRTRELRDAITTLDERTADQLETMATHAAEREAYQAREVARLEAADRQIAAGGVRLAAVGLFVVAAGIILQAIAT